MFPLWSLLSDRGREASQVCPGGASERPGAPLCPPSPCQPPRSEPASFRLERGPFRLDIVATCFQSPCTFPAGLGWSPGPRLARRTPASARHQPSLCLVLAPTPWSHGSEELPACPSSAQQTQPHCAEQPPAPPARGRREPHRPQRGPGTPEGLRGPPGSAVEEAQGKWTVPVSGDSGTAWASGASSPARAAVEIGAVTRTEGAVSEELPVKPRKGSAWREALGREPGACRWREQQAGSVGSVLTGHLP